MQTDNQQPETVAEAKSEAAFAGPSGSALQRTLLAAMAMQGILSNHSLCRDLCMSCGNQYGSAMSGPFDFKKALALNSVLYADELVQELGRRPVPNEPS